jgi:hypothetical protein
MAGMRWGDIKSRLEEAPRRIEQPATTPFDDPGHNQQFAAKTLKREVEEIERGPGYRIIRTGDGHRGWIMLYNEAEKKADYTIQYLTRQWPFLNSRTVTQVITWRDATSPFAANITKHIFYDVLLDRYPAIMSDLVQTPQGNDFWRRRMLDASQKGLRVGVVQVNQRTVDWFDPSAGLSLGQWLGPPSKTYDSAKHYEMIRYLIMK